MKESQRLQRCIPRVCVNCDCAPHHRSNHREAQREATDMKETISDLGRQFARDDADAALAEDPTQAPVGLRLFAHHA